jgi:hypothetical protein
LNNPLVTLLINLQLHLIPFKKSIRLHKLPPRIRLRAHNLSPQLVLAVNCTQRLVKPLARRNISGAAPDVQAAEEAAQSGLAVGYDLAAVDVDSEAGSESIVGNMDDAPAVLEEVLENREMGLHQVSLARITTKMSLCCTWW